MSTTKSPAMAVSRRQLGAQIGARLGVTLVEMMVSLAISASLLTAVAAAFNGSSKAIENNDQFYRATQAARVSMNQILTEVRRCTSLSVSADHTQIDMMTYNLEHRIYAYLSASGNLTITRENISPWITNTIATNITTCQFSTDGETVTMYMTVKVGNNSILLSGSATPRRSISYQ